MKAPAIVSAIQRATSQTEAIGLARECQLRRDEVRAQLEQMVAPEASQHPNPPARQKAFLAGPAALESLEREITALRYELTYLDELEMFATSRAEELRRAAIRKAAPRARAELPTALSRAGKALRNLDDALAALRDVVTPIAELASIPDEAFPLSDSETAALLELREAVWVVRHAPVLYPPVPANFPDTWGGDFPRSMNLVYERRGNGDCRKRLAPHRESFGTDFAEQPPEAWYRSSWAG